MTSSRASGATLCRWVLVCSLVLAAPAQAAVRALLIGVNDYEESKLAELRGPPNDIGLIKRVLVERFQVPLTHIEDLLNPTHTTVELAFAKLAASVQPGDQVYIHYSGHGSWAMAPPPGPGEQAERHGQDQTWVAHGARSSVREGKDAMDVLDKEIALWLDPIYKLTQDVVVVSDSCYSASVTRGNQTGVRSVDGSDHAHPLRAGIKRVPEPTVGLRIGASRDTESAVEMDPLLGARCTTKDRCYGVFTWHWAAALQSSRPGESWGAVFDRASAATTATPGVIQRPQMEGVADRAVFEGKFTPPSALVAVIDVRGDGTVVLGSGLLAGLTVGSEFETVATPPEIGARIKITSATAGAAEAELLCGKIKAGDSVRERSHQFKTIRLFVGGPQVPSEDAEFANQLHKSIREARAFALQGFEIVSNREQADWRLEFVRPPAGTPANAIALPKKVDCGAVSCMAPELWVVSPLGQLMDARMRLSIEDPSVLTPKLISNLAAFAHAREIRAMGAQGNNTMLQAQVTVLRPPAGDKSQCSVGARSDSGWQRSDPIPLNNLGNKHVQLRDCLAFTLVNADSTRTWYGYVLAVDPNFRVVPIWPAAGSMNDEARIKPGETFPVTKTFYRLSDSGRETLLFVVSSVPAPATRLASSGLKNAATRSMPSPLWRLVNASVLTRGEAETDVGDWGAQSIELDVVGAVN